MVKKWLLEQMTKVNERLQDKKITGEESNDNKNNEQYNASTGKGRKKRKRNHNMRRPVQQSPWLNFCANYRFIIGNTDKEKTKTFLAKPLPERTTIMAKAYTAFKEVAKQRNNNKALTTKELLADLYKWSWDFDDSAEGLMTWTDWEEAVAGDK